MIAPTALGIIAQLNRSRWSYRLFSSIILNTNSLLHFHYDDDDLQDHICYVQERNTQLGGFVSLEQDIRDMYTVAIRVNHSNLCMF